MKQPAPYNRESPPIAFSDILRPRVCNGCGEEKEDIQHYELRTGPTSNQVMAWCGLCAKKVVLFLLEARLQQEKAQ